MDDHAHRPNRESQPNRQKPPEIDSGLSEESVKAARSHVEMNPQLVALVKMLRRRNPKTGKRKPRRAPLRPN
jgi:hypothetical protein